MKFKHSTLRNYSFGLAQRRKKKPSFFSFKKLRWYLVPAIAFFVISAFKTVEILKTNAGHDPVPVEDFVNFESGHVHPLDMTPDGSKLLAVNTAANTLEVFTVTITGLVNTASIPVGMDPVTVRVRNNNEAWVANVISDNVSIVDLNQEVVVRTLQTADEPSDIVFAGNPRQAFVSCAERESIQIFDLNDLDTDPQEVLLVGEQPRSMAVSPDGNTVYTAFFESGNQTTVINGRVEAANGFVSNPGRGRTSVSNDVINSAGPYGGVVPVPNDGNGFNPPMNPNLPAKTDEQSLVVKKDNNTGQWLDDNGRDWTNIVSGGQGARQNGWDLQDRDVAVLDANNLNLTYQRHLGNILMAMDVNPVSGEVSVIGTDALNHIRFTPNLNGTFLRVNISQFTPGNSTNDITDLNDHLDYSSPSVAPSERQKSVGDPRGIAWRSNGQEAYITGMGSNNVIVVGPNGNRINSQPIEVGQGPTGIVLDEANGKAYVLNKFDASISTVDTNTDQEISQTSFFDPTPNEIKIGRPHMYDTHLGSGNGTISCASCHVDGKWDKLGWDLGDPSGNMETVGGQQFHPLKGLKVTQSLIDIIDKGDGLLHWRGDTETFADFASAFDALQGTNAPLNSLAMQEFEDFLKSTYHPPNPYRPFDIDQDLTFGRTSPSRTSTTNSGFVRGPGTSFQYVTRGAGFSQGTGWERDFFVRQDFITNCMFCHIPETGRGPVDGAYDNIAADLRSTYKKLGFFFNTNESTMGFGLMADGVLPTRFDTRGTGYLQDYSLRALTMTGGTPSGNLTPHSSQDSHPAMGLSETLNGNIGNVSEIDRLKGYADDYSSDPVFTELGMIVKGIYQGEKRGFMYLGGDSYQADSDGETVTHNELINAAQNNNEALTWILTHTHTANRLGIDRNSNGILDFDETISADFSYQRKEPYDIPAIVDFDASASFNPIGNTTSYAWDFGDGNTATGVNPTHSYAAADTFTVTLTTTDDNSGESDVVSKRVIIIEGCAALVGQSCNDPCMPDGIIQPDCSCLGTPAQDTDGDGICDATDQCPNFDDTLIGNSCDDGDACTINDTWLSDCNCAGTPTPDSDGDGVCDGADQCPGFVDSEYTEGLLIVENTGSDIASSRANLPRITSLNANSNLSPGLLNFAWENDSNYLSVVNDGAGSAASFRSRLLPDGSFSNTLLNANSGFNRGAGLQKALARLNGNNYLVIYNFNGVVRIYSGFFNANGTFNFRLRTTNSGLPVETLGMSKKAENEYYLLVDDGVGTAALYDAFLQADWSFTISLVNPESGISRNTVDIAWIGGLDCPEIVNEAPVAAFTATPTNGEVPLPVSFDANSSSDDVGIVNYVWDFGDGTTGNGITATHTYNTTGTYNARLTVYDVAGLTDTQNRTITVTDPVITPPDSGDCFIVNALNEVWIEAEHYSAQAPGTGTASGSSWSKVADSTASNDSALVAGPNAGVFTDLNINGPRLDYKIYFDTPGNYAVFVRAFGASGADDSFHAGLNGNSLTSDAGYGMSVPPSWTWAEEANDGLDVVLSIPSPGTYTLNIWMREDGVQLDKIFLIPVGGNGPFEEGEEENEVGPCGGSPANTAPVAELSATPTNGEGPLEVSFDGSSSTDDKGISTYVWDFGDGNTGNGATTTHTYALAGTYTASLTVSDQESLTDVKTIAITVTEPGSGDCFIVASNGEVWIEAENFSTQAPGTGNASSSSWLSYSDGTASNGSAMRAEPNDGVYTGLAANGPRLDYNIYFETPGSYSVYVRGSGLSGSDDSFHAGLNGNPLTTTAGYGMSVPTSWTWADEANDGIDLVLNISNAGQYTFNLWMREDGVSVDKIMISSIGRGPSGIGQPESTKGDCGGQVSNQAPVASFTATPPSGPAPLAVNFDANASTDDKGIVSYTWDFGDGAGGTGVGTTHSYTSAGQFTASLTVADQEGLTHSITMLIEVENPSSEDCFAEVNGEVVMEAENFSDLSPGTGNAAASTWNLITDTNASGGEALEAGPNNGVWTGLNTNGPRLDYNIDFSETGVYRIYILTSAPGPNDDSYHVGLNGSSVSSNSGWGMSRNGPWGWADYANEDDFVEVNVPSVGKHTFNVWMREDGVQIDKIILSKTNYPTGQGPAESGQSPCGGDANQAPIASFSATPSSGFAPLDVSIDASASTDPDGSIASYSWSFGDGNSGSGQTVNHTYTTVGTFTLTLTLTDNEGLSNQSSRTITVSPDTNGPICHQESAGVVVMEAENYTSTSTGTGNASGSNWQKFSDSNTSNGEGVRAMPNANVYTGLNTNGPRLDYDITFQTAGTYRVYIRANGPTGTDDSFHAGLNGQSVTSATGYGMGYTGTWFWAEEANDDPFVEVVVPSTGQHTFNIWMREDGVEIDKIVLKVQPGTPSGQGPTESALESCGDQNFSNESFSVEEEGGNADLNWGNFFEEFKDSYVLERSVDGLTYEQLEADEISVDKFTNEHIDPDIHQYDVNRIFYRLRIKDGYGRTRKERSGVLNLRTSYVSFALNAYPNPASEKLNVEYDNTSGKPLSLKVMSALGQTVHIETLDGQETHGILKLNVEKYAEGIYFVQLTDGETSQVIRILVE